MLTENKIAARHPIVTNDLGDIVETGLPWGELDGKTVLISGASGFVASYLLETLLFRNERAKSTLTRIVALVRNPAKAEARFGIYRGRPDFRLLIQDVTSPIKFEEQVDIVIHAASQASPKYYGKDPVGTHVANTVGTYNLLQMSARLNTSKFLFLSSGEIYGNTSLMPNPISEKQYGPSDPTALRSCYAEGKRAGENLCVSWGHQFGLRTTIVRLSHTYGPGMQLDDGRVFADFVANAVAGRDIAINSDGTATRPFCYLTDACVGIYTVLFRGGAGDAYNLANDEAIVSISELAQIVSSLAPGKNIRPVYTTGPHSSSYVPSTHKGSVPDTTKIRLLGWQPSVSIEEGFRRTISSYLAST